MKEKLSFTRVIKSKAIQWSKPGDHDGVAQYGDLPNVGDCFCCKRSLRIHGTVKDTGETVCPGNWLVEENEFDLLVVTDEFFRKEYVENTGDSLSAKGIQGSDLKLELVVDGVKGAVHISATFLECLKDHFDRELHAMGTSFEEILAIQSDLMNDSAITGKRSDLARKVVVNKDPDGFLPHPDDQDLVVTGLVRDSVETLRWSAAGAAPPTYEFSGYGRGLFTTSVDGPIKAVVDGVEVPIPKLVEEIERLLAATLQSLSDSEARCDKLRRFKEQFWGMINMERMRDPEVGLRTIIRRLNKGDNSEPTHLVTRDFHGWNAVMGAFGVTNRNLTPLTFNGLAAGDKRGSFAVEIDGKRAHILIAPLTWDSLQEQWSQALFTAHGCTYQQALEFDKDGLTKRMEGIPGTLEAVAKAHYKIDDPGRAVNVLHKLWDKAVGTDDYVKAEWSELECRIEKRETVTLVHELRFMETVELVHRLQGKALGRGDFYLEQWDELKRRLTATSGTDHEVPASHGSDDDCDEPASEPDSVAHAVYGGFHKDHGMRLEVQIGEHLGGYLYMSAKEFENLAIQFNRDNVSYHGKTLYETLGSEPVFVSADSEEVRKLYAKISSDRSFEIEQLKLGHRGEQKRLSNRIADLKKELKVLRDHEEVRAESPPIPPIDSGSLYEPPTESPSPSPESGWSYLQASLEQYKNNQTAVRERQAARERKSDAMLTISDKGAIGVKKSFHEIDIGDETHAYLGTIWGSTQNVHPDDYEADKDVVTLSPAHAGITITMLSRVGNIILKDSKCVLRTIYDHISLAKVNNSWREVSRSLKEDETKFDIDPEIKRAVSGEHPTIDGDGRPFDMPDMMDPATGKITKGEDQPTTQHLAIRNPGPFEVIILSVHEDNFESVASLIDDELGGCRSFGGIPKSPLKGGVTLPFAEHVASMLREAGAVVEIQREKGFTRQFGAPAEKPDPEPQNIDSGRTKRALDAFKAKFPEVDLCAVDINIMQAWHDADVRFPMWQFLDPFLADLEAKLLAKEESDATHEWAVMLTNFNLHDIKEIQGVLGLSTEAAKELCDGELPVLIQRYDTRDLAEIDAARLEDVGASVEIRLVSKVKPVEPTKSQVIYDPNTKDPSLSPTPIYWACPKCGERCGSYVRAEANKLCNVCSPEPEPKDELDDEPQEHKDYCTADGYEDYDENGTCLECGEENTRPSWNTSGTNEAAEEVTAEFQTAIFLLLENLNKRVGELSKSIEQAIVKPNDHKVFESGYLGEDQIKAVEYDVILRTTPDGGAKKVQAIKGILAVVPGCSLSEAKNICETTPKVLRRWVALSLAEEFAELLAKAGCTVDIGEIGSGKIIATRSGSDRTAEHPNWNCGNSSYPKCTMPFKATGPEPHRDMKPTITAQPEMQTDGYLGEDQGNDGPPEPTSKPTEPVADSLVPGRFGKFDKNDPVSFWGSVKDVAHKKVLIALGGKEVWITKSDIVDGSALTGLSRQFDHGILIIPRWVAVDNGLGIMARLLPPELAGNTKEMAIQLYDAAKLYKDFTFDIISEQEQEHWLDKARDILAPYCHGIEPEPPGSVLDTARRGYRCDCSDCLEARCKKVKVPKPPMS